MPIRLGAASLILVLGGCASRPQLVQPLFGERAMIADSRYTLYEDGGFALASLPEHADEQQFWENLGNQIRITSGGATTISLNASNRILRVVQVNHNVSCAFHYAIIRSGPNSANIRLQPIVAWARSMDDANDAAPILAANALPMLPDLATRLKAAADQAVAQ